MNKMEIMRRYRHPVYRGNLADFYGKYAAASGGRLATASGDNPFCGDTLSIALWLTGEEDVVEDVCYEGYGCSLCMASAEMLMEKAVKRTGTEGLRIGPEDLLTGLEAGTIGRSRIKCVELSLTVFRDAIRGC